jgi:hypothetical protein
VAGVVGAQQRSSAASTGENGRYTLHQVTVETSGQITAQHPEVFMIDSRTGKVWRYQPSFSYEMNGKTQVSNESMVPVPGPQ